MPRRQQVIFGFEPGDIVSEVMSFGSPTPIEVVVASPNLAEQRYASITANVEGEDLG